MLMLCRALLPNPKIVLLDEPTVGLDPFARRMMWQMIRDLHHQGLTFILTTHYMEEAQMLCHRVAFMRKGCVLGVKTPEDWILQLGRFAVDHFENETVKTYYFNCKKEAITYTEHLSSDFLLRETNLEDVFLETVGKGFRRRMAILTVIWEKWIEFKHEWIKITISSLITPLLYLITFGLGIGNFITTGDRPYLQFLIPGIIALTTMNSSFNAVGMSLNVQRLYEHSFDSIMASPTPLWQYIIGQMIGGSLRGMYARTLILIISLLFSVQLCFSIWFLELCC